MEAGRNAVGIATGLAADREEPVGESGFGRLEVLNEAPERCQLRREATRSRRHVGDRPLRRRPRAPCGRPRLGGARPRGHLGLGCGEPCRQGLELVGQRGGGARSKSARVDAIFAWRCARRRPARSRARRSTPCRSSLDERADVGDLEVFDGIGQGSRSVGRPARERARRPARDHQCDPASFRCTSAAASARLPTTRSCTISSWPSRSRSARPTWPPSSSAIGST